jgi:hypothetical protein
MEPTLYDVLTAPPRVSDLNGRPIPAYNPTQFCVWLEGARELGAFSTGELSEGQRDMIRSRLDRVMPDGRGDADPCARLVRDLRGAERLGLPWWGPGGLMALCISLEACWRGAPADA